MIASSSTPFALASAAAAGEFEAPRSCWSRSATYHANASCQGRSGRSPSAAAFVSSMAEKEGRRTAAFGSVGTGFRSAEIPASLSASLASSYHEQRPVLVTW